MHIVLCRGQKKTDCRPGIIGVLLVGLVKQIEGGSWFTSWFKHLPTKPINFPKRTPMPGMRFVGRQLKNMSDFSLLASKGICDYCTSFYCCAWSLHDPLKMGP